ncbi:alanine racemase [Treponema phagedenis]|uniref:Putative amino acid racemase n=1 Tax=Treponema phagedenis TaxID=162 RepID=A0A0B7GT32_TREPH|nr:alanine racemase [Treponema phagedenis]NVP22996.1 alanine racemase [Treponema phagedenis]QEJ95120.1 YhfX family PLP-dependent enzyme [Treponema phagedenis]QEJ98207.1 YhfX family PLP-dependent enzyme [Treponema phagedenis]QEK01044.1 YhfX family PLP-dependent enzyme [Treponema phagedenis]QEK03715.1 YhfX family PLP-dependent enzyme [Treponema phagedenis]
MFLNQIEKRNRQLVKTAFLLHQNQEILPDSYIVDVDVFLENAELILKSANEKNIKLYFMLKQVGRNPYLASELMKLGYSGAVTVDFREALVMMRHKIPIGNVGHLVQVPQAMIKEIVAYKPEVITVYSKEKIQAIEDAAKELRIKQGIMLRVYGDNDTLYSGQMAGIHLHELKETVLWIKSNCLHVEIKGITSFPCYLYSEKDKDILPTANLGTVQFANEILKTCGVTAQIINTPASTCCRTLNQMLKYGGNCGEPGHGLSGTTIMHADFELEERPAVVYVSEISHNFGGNAYCYGGGYYRRSHVKNVLVGISYEERRRLLVIPPTHESIDYHLGISDECKIGDTALMAFRFQIFSTRSDVVLVKGIQHGKYEIVGIYDSHGRKKEEL